MSLDYLIERIKTIQDKVKARVAYQAFIFSRIISRESVYIDQQDTAETVPKQFYPRTKTYLHIHTTYFQTL